MSNVVDLSHERVVRSPHREGRARCLNCKHEWTALAAAGTVALPCPSCSSSQGVFNGLAHTEFRQWECRCGEMTFFIDEFSPYCAHCGVRPELPHAGPRPA